MKKLFYFIALVFFFIITSSYDIYSYCQSCPPSCITDAECADTDNCTVDTCENGDCHSIAKDCGYLNNQCNVGICDPGTGNCEQDPLPLNGNPCNDGNLCTLNDICVYGACSGSAKDCSALSGPCSVGVCNPGTGYCQQDPSPKNGDPCFDTDKCTENEICDNGTCVGTRIPDCSSCAIEIALGRSCPGEEIDDPAYNRPGRRGLAATCNDVIDFTVCSDCVPFNPSCLVWSINPPAAFLSIAKVDSCCWRLSIGDACKQLDKIAEYEVTVTDTCNNTSDSVVVEIGKVIIDIGDTTVQPNTESARVDIDLINPEHHIRAMITDICECSGGEDKLVCTDCRVDANRAYNFTCSASERPDGCCRVVLYSTDPAAVIAQGRGRVAEVVYQAGDAEVGECICLRPENRQVSDEFNEDICTCESPGEVCFRTCGDVYPQDCLGGSCADTSCGDGVVDLFDILEVVDIILGLQTATDCQLGNGDVPNGKPPYCGSPSGTPNCDTDGDIDLFDVLVIIDKALGIMNCCDYCLFGQIF